MARRVNSKFLVFLVTLSAAVLLAGVSAFYFRVKARSVDYRQLEAQADEAIHQGDLEKGARLMKDARDQVPDNTEILVKLGNVLDRLTGKDPIHLGEARIQWNKAVSVDPHCVPALRALLKSYADELDLNPRPEVFVELKRICDRLLNVEPTDLPAQEKKQVAVIHEWLANQTASNDEVRESIETYLPELIQKDPGNPELPRTLALARIQEARQMLDSNNNEAARFVLNEATRMLDAARRGREDNAGMQYRAFQSYLMIKRMDPDVKSNKEKEKAYDDRINACIDAALALELNADPSKDLLCDDIHQAASEWASQQNKTDKAESIMRRFYEAHPDDQRARLTMARVLEFKGDTKSREEAVAILSKDVADGQNMAGFQALVQRDLSAQTVAELIRIRLAEFSTAPASDADKRKQLAGRIDEQFDKLRHLYPPQSVPVLNLEGRFHLQKGENVEAVKTFEEAVLQMPPSNVDPDLLYQLAIAYTRTGQPGRARQKLEQVILKLDSAVPPRILLARVLLQFKDLPGAAVQLRKLQELAPQSPEVKQLAASLTLTNYVQDPTGAASVYAQMPEKSRDERLTKAQVAVAMGRGDEAARILKAFLEDASDNARLAAQPAPNASDDQKKEAALKVAQDTQASLTLAQVYAGELGQKETAKRVVADSLKLHPDDPTLVDADARLRDLLPEDIYSLVSKAVQKTSDPFTRHMQTFDLESREAQRLTELRQDAGWHAEQAFAHLLAANKLKPDDTRVLDLMFGQYVSRGKFDSAVPLVEKLAAQNADQCRGLMYRYRLALVRGDLAAAEDFGRQLTRDFQEFAASWLVTAQVLQLRGKFDEAIQFFLEVLNRQPGQYDAYRGLIECYFRTNQPENAEIRLREARTHYPNDIRLRDDLLVYLVNYGKAADAIPEREKILNSNKQQQKDVADDYLQLAKAYFHAAQDEATARPADSADHLNKAFETLAHGQEKFPDDGHFASQLAEMYQYNRDLDAGEKVLTDLYNRPDLKDDPEPALLLSDFYARAGKFEKSEFFLNEAMVKAEKKEGHPDIAIRLRMASLQAQQHKFEAAYNTLNGVGNPSKTDPSVIRQRLEIMIAEGRRDEALKGLEFELTKRDGADLHNLKASLLIDSRELDAALKEVDHVLALDPRNDAAVYLQSLALARKGEVTRAISQLVALRNRDLRNAQVRLLLAELYSKTGKTDYAIRELEDGLQKIPINRDLRLTLIQLHRGERPLTNDALNEIIKICLVAEADPVLRSDPTWAREEALAFASMEPAMVPNAIVKWQQVISLAPDKPDYRREFVDLLIQFHDWNAVMNETDRLMSQKHDEWWLHYQRGMAMAHQDQKDKAIVEFDTALKVTDLNAAPGQGEFIIRGLGENCGHELALKRLMPLLANDPGGHWRLLQASELRVEGQFQKAEDIVDALLTDPLNKPAERRTPLLRAKADICQAFANADARDAAKSLAQNFRARDAYVELLRFAPEDTVSLNNLAYLLSERIPPPQGGPQKAREYSSKAYDLVRFDPVPNVLVIDTQGWVLTLCGGDDANEGLSILRKMIVDREDTKTFIEGRYHLGEAYLRAAKPDLDSAQKWLKEAMNLIALDEQAGRAVDLALKDKVQTSLAKATGPVTSGR